MNRLLNGRLPIRILRKTPTLHSTGMGSYRASSGLLASNCGHRITSIRNKIWKSSIASCGPVEKSAYVYITDALTKYANETPEKAAVLNALIPKRKITYGQFRKEILGLEAFLHETGFRKGEVAASIVPSCVEFPVMFTATIGRGGIFTGISVLNSDAVIERHLKECKPKVVFVSEKTLKKLQKVFKTIPTIQTVIVVRMTRNPLPPGVIPWNRAINCPSTPPNVDVDCDDVALRSFSNETSGMPKVVEMTHRNLMITVNGLVKYHNEYELPYIDKMFSNQERKEMSGATLMYFPFNNTLGNTATITSLITGQPIVFIRKFDRVAFLYSLQQFKITKVFLIPSMAHFLVKNPLTTCFNLSSLRLAVCAGAIHSKEICQAFEKKYPRVKLVQSYGVTECGGFSHLPFDLTETDSWTNCGSLMPDIEARVVDNGKELDVGGKGELQLRGPGISKNFKGEEDLVDKEGWLHTGDLVYIDEIEKLHFVKKMAQFIEVEGKKVVPAELEQVLLNCSRLQDAAVVGIPHWKYGQVPGAIVVKKDPNLTEADVKKMVEDSLDEHKWLTGGVQFVKKIPKILSEKVVRKVFK